MPSALSPLDEKAATAQKLANDGKWDAALSAYCEALTLLPGGTAAPWLSSECARNAMPFYRLAAGTALLARNLGAAHYFYECALMAAFQHSLPPDRAYTELLQNAANVREDRGDLAGAVHLLDQALRMKRAWPGNNSVEIALDECHINRLKERLKRTVQYG